MVRCFGRVGLRVFFVLCLVGQVRGAAAEPDAGPPSDLDAGPYGPDLTEPTAPAKPQHIPRSDRQGGPVEADLNDLFGFEVKGFERTGQPVDFIIDFNDGETFKFVEHLGLGPLQMDSRGVPVPNSNSPYTGEEFNDRFRASMDKHLVGDAKPFADVRYLDLAYMTPEQEAAALDHLDELLQSNSIDDRPLIIRGQNGVMTVRSNELVAVEDPASVLFNMSDSRSALPASPSRALDLPDLRTRMDSPDLIPVSLPVNVTLIPLDNLVSHIASDALEHMPEPVQDFVSAASDKLEDAWDPRRFTYDNVPIVEDEGWGQWIYEQVESRLEVLDEWGQMISDSFYGINQVSPYL